MTLHKLFKELSKLSEEEVGLLYEALGERNRCKRVCGELGVKYTDKRLAKYIFERNKNGNCKTTYPNTTLPPGPTLKQLEQIICGTNLDIIEEAAEKKGLL
jgi:hypothetical protein